MSKQVEFDLRMMNGRSITWEKSDGSILKVLSMDTSNNVSISAALSAIQLANNVNLTALNAAGSSTVNILKLDTNNKITLGAPISFDGTNYLGTFSDAAASTPVPSGAAGAINTQTTTGRWARVGPLVFLNIKCVLTDIGTASGALTITLPSEMPAAASISMDQPLAVDFDSITEATVQLTAVILNGTKTIQFHNIVTNASTTVLAIENGTLIVSGQYFAA